MDYFHNSPAQSKQPDSMFSPGAPEGYFATMSGFQGNRCFLVSLDC